MSYSISSKLIHNCNCNNFNPVSVNSGGGLTMKKKAGNKFNKISANNFSLNGINNNNISYYIGNPNNAISNTTCKTNDTNIKTSVKTYSGLMRTRITNNDLKCNSVNSFQCYKDNNKELIDLFNANKKGVNKHFTVNNKDQSSRIEILKSKSKCMIERSKYNSQLQENQANKECAPLTNKATSTNKTQYLARKCNVTKDMNKVSGYTPGYGLYYNDSTLFKKKQCLHNPPDAKILAC